MTSPSQIAIEIHMFRGGGLPGRPVVEDARLEKYGHVGIALIGAKAKREGAPEIAGFNPWVPPGMPRGEFLRLLAAGASFPGQVNDDTELFARARESRLLVVEKRGPLDRSLCLAVRRRLKHDQRCSPMSRKRYSLPPRDGGGFAANVFNCQTYPLSLGIPEPAYPYGSGRIGDVILKNQYLILKYECR